MQAFMHILLLASIIAAAPTSTTSAAESSSTTELSNPFTGSAGAIGPNVTAIEFTDATAIHSLVTAADRPISGSTNWAGAVVSKPPSGRFIHATGTFVVPKASRPGIDHKQYGVASSVGIGDKDILQTGVTSTVNADGSHH